MILKQHNICYKCCASNKHVARDCDVLVKCSECHSERHPTALHSDAPHITKPPQASADHGGEIREDQEETVVSSCTEVCGVGLAGKSCAKICLVAVYPENDPTNRKKMYAMLDDQSNVSLARSEFFDIFKVHSNPTPYTLQTCSGTGLTAGRRAFGYIIESIDGTLVTPLPTLIECNMIPNKREEIPTPAAANAHRHLASIAHEVPPLDCNAEILLLLGRDILRVHKVRSQINGPHDAPYAQRLDLGWVIVGDVCLGSTHKPPQVTTLKTHILTNGRPTYFPSCESHFATRPDIRHPNEKLSFINTTVMKKKEAAFKAMLEQATPALEPDDSWETVKERLLKEAALGDVTLESKRKRIVKHFMHVLEHECQHHQSKTKKHSEKSKKHHRKRSRPRSGSETEEEEYHKKKRRSASKTPSERSSSAESGRSYKKHKKKASWKKNNYFWSRWRKEYLNSLQARQKWHRRTPDVKEGDVILLKDKQTRRNEWPMGVIVKTIPSEDGIVRKAEVRVASQGTVKTFYRPISEMVLLFSGAI